MKIIRLFCYFSIIFISIPMWIFIHNYTSCIYFIKYCIANNHPCGYKMALDFWVIFMCLIQICVSIIGVVYEFRNTNKDR